MEWKCESKMKRQNGSILKEEGAIYRAQSYKELDITETERALNAGQTIESATFVKDIVSLTSQGP